MPEQVFLLTMCIPLWQQCTYLIMAISWQIMDHVTKHMSQITQSQWNSMVFPITRSESNGAFLGHGRTADSQHEYAADKSVAVMRSCQCRDQNLKRVFGTPYGIHAMKNCGGNKRSMNT